MRGVLFETKRSRSIQHGLWYASLRTKGLECDDQRAPRPAVSDPRTRQLAPDNEMDPRPKFG